MSQESYRGFPADGREQETLPGARDVEKAAAQAAVLVLHKFYNGPAQTAGAYITPTVFARLERNGGHSFSAPKGQRLWAVNPEALVVEEERAVVLIRYIFEKGGRLLDVFEMRLVGGKWKLAEILPWKQKGVLEGGQA